MPFICLADPNIPDGIVQILDLTPNESQRNGALDPPGQTRYINRVQNDAVGLATTAVVHADGVAGSRITSVSTVAGLAAYLADRVDPAATQAAVGQTTIAACVATDTFVLGGVTFTAVAGGANAALQEWNDVASAGSDTLSAASLVLALNNAATDTALAVAGGCSVTAALLAPGSDVVVMTADTVGGIGAMSMSGTALTVVPDGDHLVRAHDAWTAAQLNAAAAALISRMDAGLLGMTATNINTWINAVAGVSGVSILAGTSTATLVGILSILAGRGYLLPAGTVMADYGWHVPSDGSFTESVQVFGTTMISGEIRPVASWMKHKHQVATGGDTENRELKPIRYTTDSTSFQVSLGQGQIDGFTTGVTLFPDSSLTAFVPTFYQPGPKQVSIANSRVVTVYGDDGTLLA